MNALASMQDGAMGLRPFDPDTDLPQDVGLGGNSTEYIITERAPDGGFWNIPSIWWKDGKPQVIDDPQTAQFLAMEFERQSGKRFPRFMNSGQGTESAMHRSAMGGASMNALAKFGGR